MGTALVDTPQYPDQIRGIPFVLDPSVESQHRYLATASQVQPLFPGLDWTGLGLNSTLSIQHWLIVGETDSHYFLRFQSPLPFLEFGESWEVVEKSKVGTEESQFFHPHER